MASTAHPPGLSLSRALETIHANNSGVAFLCLTISSPFLPPMREATTTAFPLSGGRASTGDVVVVFVFSSGSSSCCLGAPPCALPAHHGAPSPPRFNPFRCAPPCALAIGGLHTTKQGMWYTLDNARPVAAFCFLRTITPDASNPRSRTCIARRESRTAAPHRSTDGHRFPSAFAHWTAARRIAESTASMPSISATARRRSTQVGTPSVDRSGPKKTKAP